MKDPPQTRAPGAFDVLAVVASLGGHDAIVATLSGLPPDFSVPIIVMQHLGPDSTGSVAIYGRKLPFAVDWARPDSALAPGKMLVCPPRSFVELVPDGTCIVSPCERGAMAKPIDRFLDSIARSFGPRAIGVVLTGMGSDGALGARQLRVMGGRVLVQSEASCDSAEMPNAAIRAGAAQLVAPLKDLGQVIGEIVRGTPHPQPRSETEAIRAIFGDEGQIAALARDMNWSGSALGPAREWSPVLRSVVRLAIDHPTPYTVLWGPRLVQLYNDAAIVTHGGNHPRIFGVPVYESAPELRETLGSVWRRVLAGETIHQTAVLVPTARGGRIMDAWFDFVHSPVREAGGAIGGIASVWSDRTDEVLASRRLRTINAFTELGIAASRREALMQTLGAFRDAPDVLFAVAYDIAPSARHATLVGSAGVTEGSALAPWTAPFDAGPWPLDQVVRERRAAYLDDLAKRFPGGPEDAGGANPEHAAVFPLIEKATDRVAGVLILGASPRLFVDDRYRDFLQLAAEVVASRLTEAHARELERERGDRLAELDRAKTEFFANVSHEFRTPLTLLLAPLEEMLRRREELPATLAQEVDVAASNSRRLLRLVDNLLDFSQADTRRRRAAFAPTDLAALTVDIASAFRSAIEAAGLRFRVECDPQMSPVWIDRAMWETIVSNLLANAFKFTFEGEIAIELRGLSLHAELIVRDTGVGIPQRELPHLFKRFHRVCGARARTAEGAGIGLSLVDDHVRRLGGQVRVRSTEGRGTAFTLWVPYKTARIQADTAAPGATAVAGEQAEELAKDATRWLGDSSKTPVEVQEDLLGVSPDATGARRGTILVVDDNADLRAYLHRLLSTRWEVELVADGEAALKAARRRRPDLVLADVMMPGMDGFRVMRTLREDPALQHTPVVLLTARAGEEAAIQGLLAGADDYIAKPFSARELIARVGGQIELSRARRRTQELNAFLVRFSDAVRGERNPDAIAQVARRMIRDRLGATGAYWCVVDWATREYVVTAADDIPGKEPARMRQPLDAWEPLTTQCMQGRPMVVHDAQADALDSAQRDRWAPMNSGAALAAPVLVDGTLRAVLGVDQPKRRQWSAEEIALIEGLAGRCWPEVERARAEQALRESETHLATELADARVLQNISNELVSEGGPNGHFGAIVDAARTLMRSDAASIQELDAADSRLKLVAHTGFHAESAAFWEYVDADGGSVCGRALTARKRVVVPDIDVFEADSDNMAAFRKSGIMSVQSTPLVASSGRVVGMMSTHWNHPHTPSAESYRFFDILARLAADFVERARAKAALRESEERQASLLERYRNLFETTRKASLRGEITARKKTRTASAKAKTRS